MKVPHLKFTLIRLLKREEGALCLIVSKVITATLAIRDYGNTCCNIGKIIIANHIPTKTSFPLPLTGQLQSLFSPLILRTDYLSQYRFAEVNPFDRGNNVSNFL